MIPDDLPRRILEGSPDVFLVSNREGTIIYWNAAAERILGYSAFETLGRSMDIIIPEKLRNRHWAGWKKVMETGITRYGDGQLLAVPALHKAGHQLSIEFSIQLLKKNDGRIEWVIAVIRDVTDHFVRDKAMRARLNRFEKGEKEP